MGKQKPKRISTMFFIVIIIAFSVVSLQIFIPTLSEVAKARIFEGVGDNGVSFDTDKLRNDQFAWINPLNIEDSTQQVAFTKFNGDENDKPRFYRVIGDPGCTMPANPPTRASDPLASYGTNELTYLSDVGPTLAFIDFKDSIDLNRKPSGNLYYFSGSVGSVCQATFVKRVTPDTSSATAAYKYVSYSQIVPNYINSLTNDSDAMDNLKGMNFNVVPASAHEKFENIAKDMGKPIEKNTIVYADNNAPEECASFIAILSKDGKSGRLFARSIDENDNKCRSGVNGVKTRRGGVRVMKTTRVLTTPVNVVIADPARQFDEKKARNPDPGRSYEDILDANESEPESCEGSILGLGWLICNLVDLISKFAGWVDEQLKEILLIDTNQFDNNVGLETAWSAIRIMATVVLLGVALIMIIAQMLNLDMISAYTFKKMIPRLVTGVVLIQLSWFIGIFMIDVFNLLGSAIQDLIAAPFGGSGKLSTIATLFNTYKDSASGWSKAGAMSFLGIGLVAGFGAVGGGFGLLALALSVLIAVLIAFVTLIIRKVVILALLIIAPLAIIAWLLPNTQDWWKKYWDLIIKLLVMFPLVMGALMLGKVFAKIVVETHASGLESTANYFIFIISYFAPWYFIPSMIKANGTIFSRLADGIGKAGGRLKETRPFRRIEEARKRNIEARDYNSKARGRAWAQGQGIVGRVPLVGRGIGRIVAGTAGSRGAHARLYRAQEREKLLKENELQAQMEYEDATRYQDFGDRMAEAETLAMARVGDTVTLNGRQVRVTEALRSHGYGELVGGKRGEAARRVLQYHRNNENYDIANDLQNRHVTGLLPQAPDVYKGARGFSGLSVGDAAQMDEAGWRNMAMRASWLQNRGGAITPGQRQELDRLAELARGARTDSRWDQSMTGEKRRYAELIETGGAGTHVFTEEQTRSVPDGAGGTTTYSKTSRVDWDGNREHIFDEAARRWITNPAYNGRRDGGDS